MKRIFLIGSIVAVILALAGCEFLDSLRQKILGQASTTAGNVGYQLEKTKMSVEEKTKQVDEALKKIHDAAEQVKKASEEVQAAADAVKNAGK